MKRLVKTNQRKKGGKPVSELQQEYNKYIIVITSLEQEISTAQVLELYRMRWQIEIAFKHLKSIFRYNEMPARLSENIFTWFYGKLLLAALCETLVNIGRFSPQENVKEKAMDNPAQLSLYRELYIAQTLLVVTLLESLIDLDLFELLSRLSDACKDSKRKRLPQLCFFSSA